MRSALHTEHAPPPVGAYSQAVVAAGLAYVAGQAGKDIDGRIVVGGIEAETRQTLRNIEVILGAAGLTLDDVVKVTVYLADRNHFADFDATYRQFFSAPFPARTTVGSQLDNILVEIDVVAAMRSAK